MRERKTFTLLQSLWVRTLQFKPNFCHKVKHISLPFRDRYTSYSSPLFLFNLITWHYPSRLCNTQVSWEIYIYSNIQIFVLHWMHLFNIDNAKNKTHSSQYPQHLLVKSNMNTSSDTRSVTMHRNARACCSEHWVKVERPQGLLAKFYIHISLGIKRVTMHPDARACCSEP